MKELIAGIVVAIIIVGGITGVVLLLLYLFAYIGQKEEQEEKLKRETLEREYLSNNPVPYIIKELVPQTRFLISLKTPIDREIPQIPLLQRGVEELKKKFEVNLIEVKSVDEQMMEVPAYRSNSVLLVWVKPKS